MTKNGNKTPAFPWFPRDFSNDEPVQLMTLEEEGAYRRLLDHQWLHGSIPADLGQLAKVCKNVKPARMKKLWKAIQTLFPPMDGDPTRLQNRKAERVRQSQREYRDRQAEAGRRGAESRWRKDGNPIGERDGDPIADPVAKPCLAVASAVAVASSSSSAADFERLADGMDDLGRSALEGYLRASPAPDRLLAELFAMVSGLHGPGGRGVSQKDLGRALHEMALAGGNPTASVLRGFVRRIQQGDPPPRQAAKSDDDDLAQWARDKEAQLAAKRA